MTTNNLEDLQVLHSEMLATAVDLGVKVPEDLTLEFSTVEVGRATCDGLDALIKKFRPGLDESANAHVPDENLEESLTTKSDDVDGAVLAEMAEAEAPRPGGSKPRRRRSEKSAPARISHGDEAVVGPNVQVAEFEDNSLDPASGEPLGKGGDAGENAAAAKKSKRAPSVKPSKGKSKQPSAKPAEEKDVAKTAKKAAAPKKAAKKAPAKKAAAKKAATPKKAKAAKASTVKPMPAARKYGDGAKIKVLDKNPAALQKKSKWADRLRSIIAANGKKVKDAGIPLPDLRTAEWRGVIEVVD